MRTFDSISIIPGVLLTDVVSVVVVDVVVCGVVKDAP